MARLAHHDRVVDGLAVVLRGGDRGHAGIVVGENVAPRSHPGEVDLVIGERDGNAGPVRGGDQLEVAVDLLGEIGEERLVGLRGLGGRRLERPDPEADLAAVAEGRGRTEVDRRSMPSVVKSARRIGRMGLKDLPLAAAARMSGELPC